MVSDKFRAWVKRRGISKLSAEIGAGVSTIYSWMNGTATPRDKYRQAILKLAHGRIKLGDIVDGY
jgi:hypothetical protein